MTEKTLSSRQNLEHLTPHLSSTSRNEKISQYCNSDFLSSRLSGQGLTETCSKSLVLNISPASDYDFTITPPPSASLSSRLDNGRRDRENPLFLAGMPALPQSLGIYGGFVPINEHEIVLQHSMQTIEYQNPSQSRITSWSDQTTGSPSYLMLPKANEGQASLGV